MKDSGETHLNGVEEIVAISRMVGNSCLPNSGGFAPYQRAFAENIALPLRRGNVNLSTLSKIGSTDEPEVESAASHFQTMMKVETKSSSYGAQV